MEFLKNLLYIFFLLVSFLGTSQNSHLFEKGKEQYRDGEYQQAVSSWEEILKNGEASASLYFNIGNAYYKLNRIGPAIFNYEKALQFSPGDRDIKNNLAFAENARIDNIEPLPESVFSKWYKSIANVFTYDGWAILSIVFSIGSALLFLLYYFSQTERIKRWLFAGSMIFIAFLGIAIALAYSTFNDVQKDRPAIIFAEELNVRSEPSLGGNFVFRLHEGTKVQIIGYDNHWYRIQLADGKDGWVPKESVRPINEHLQ